jgi:hypothetical protein
MEKALNPDLQALILFEEIVGFRDEVEDLQKYAIFVKMKREYEESLLLEELNKSNESKDS